MSKYIDVNKLKEKFEEIIREMYVDDPYRDGKRDAFIWAEDVVDEMPSADVAEVKHGKWEYVEIFDDDVFGIDIYKGYRCSECDGIEPVNSRFCPNCGADMRERKDTE